MTRPAAQPATLADAPPRAAQVRVLFFGPVRATLGVASGEIPWAQNGSTAQMWSQLLARYPALAALRPSIRLARNGEFLRDGESVQPGDELALIPPVSGG